MKDVSEFFFVDLSGDDLNKSLDKLQHNRVPATSTVFILSSLSLPRDAVADHWHRPYLQVQTWKGNKKLIRAEIRILFNILTPVTMNVAAISQELLNFISCQYKTAFCTKCCCKL